MPYTDDDMLLMSGIQHYVFCPRQWALIHIEQVWADNHLTIEGQLQHAVTNNPYYRQKNGDAITLRAVNLASYRLGLNGVADSIQLMPTDDENNFIRHPKYPGKWIPYPIEYKHGKTKLDNCDIVQLVAQAMSLEEMYGVAIAEGAIFYKKEQSRLVVRITDDLRKETQSYADDMHRAFKAGVTPKAICGAKCKSCSIQDLCAPKIAKLPSVRNYLKNSLYEETT